MNIITAHKLLDDELDNAESKFPKFPIDPVHAAAILQEEAGELIQAALQFTYEGGSYDAVRKEAIQVGAMALRFLVNMVWMNSRPSEQVERLTGNVQQTLPAAPGVPGLASHIGNVCYARTLYNI
jgi:NTP pyrophosphatase (non-canonical NTP hydrolase)